MHTLVIIRHGESQWNKLNLFCGWTDVDLTETGYEEAHQAGRLLREGNYHFDICYTSVLKRPSILLILFLMNWIWHGFPW